MGLAWTTIGLIAGLNFFVLVELSKRRRLDWKSWTGLIVGEFLLLFCVAWCIASIAEGVPRSASMGLIMFGGLGLVTIILTWRLLIQNAESISRALDDEERKQPPEANSSNRRDFFGQSLFQAIGWRRAAAGGAAIGAAGVASYAVIKSQGTPLDDVPNAISDNYP